MRSVICVKSQSDVEGRASKSHFLHFSIRGRAQRPFFLSSRFSEALPSKEATRLSGNQTHQGGQSLQNVDPWRQREQESVEVVQVYTYVRWKNAGARTLDGGGEK